LLIALLGGIFFTEIYPKLTYQDSKNVSLTRYTENYSTKKSLTYRNKYRRTITRDGSSKINGGDCPTCPTRRPETARERRFVKLGEDLAYKYCLCCKKRSKAEKCKEAIMHKWACRKNEIRSHYERELFMGAFQKGIGQCK